jgi:hypothetical protein
MISPMNIPVGNDSICIDYAGDEYISYPCGASAGASFNILGTDVTASVSSIDHGQFTTNMVAVVDPTQYIVDDAFNAYYKVTQYTTTQTTRPPRV